MISVSSAAILYTFGLILRIMIPTSSNDHPTSGSTCDTALGEMTGPGTGIAGIAGIGPTAEAALSSEHMKVA